MSFQHFPGIGLVHLQEVRRPRIVPAGERHKWDKKIGRGEVATCLKCGAQKLYQMDYEIRYTVPGRESNRLTERPACTGGTVTGMRK